MGRVHCIVSVSEAISIGLCFLFQSPPSIPASFSVQGVVESLDPSCISVDVLFLTAVRCCNFNKIWKMPFGLHLVLPLWVYVKALVCLLKIPLLFSPLWWGLLVLSSGFSLLRKVLDGCGVDEEVSTPVREVEMLLSPADSTLDVEQGEEEHPPPGLKFFESLQGSKEEKELHWSRLLSLASANSGLVAVSCLVLLVRLPFSIARTHFIAESVGDILQRDSSKLEYSVGALVVVGLVDALLDFWCVYLFCMIQQKIVKNLRRRLFGSLLSLPLPFFDAQSSGDLTSRLTSDTGQMANDLSWVFRFSIESLVRVTGVGGYMFFFQWRLALLACSLTPICTFLSKIYGKMLNKNAKNVQDALARANGHASEILGNMRTVKSFANEGVEFSKFTIFLTQYYNLQMFQSALDSGYYMFINGILLNVLIESSLLSYAAFLIFHGQMGPAKLISFMLYRSQLQEYLNLLIGSYSNLVKGAGASSRVFQILDMAKQRGCRDVWEEIFAEPLLSEGGERQIQGGISDEPSQPLETEEPFEEVEAKEKPIHEGRKEGWEETVPKRSQSSSTASGLVQSKISQWENLTSDTGDSTEKKRLEGRRVKQREMANIPSCIFEDSPPPSPLRRPSVEFEDEEEHLTRLSKLRSASSPQESSHCVFLSKSNEKLLTRSSMSHSKRRKTHEMTGKVGEGDSLGSLRKGDRHSQDQRFLRNTRESVHAVEMEEGEKTEGKLGEPEEVAGRALRRARSSLGKLEVRGLCFGYAKSSRVNDKTYLELRPVLNLLSFSVPPGACLAVVGQSGVGKSSLVSLLLRLYDPLEGCILVDGQDISKVSPKEVRREYFGEVSQEPTLFSGSVKANVLYGLEAQGLSKRLPRDLPSAQPLNSESLEEQLCLHALEVANAKDFVLRLPRGIYEEVGEKGVHLSGGQKQRIAIARAVAMNARILLLDEATSALDAESETAVREALDRVMREKTTVMITHRMSSVLKHADVCVVLGRVQQCEGSRRTTGEKKGFDEVCGSMVEVGEPQELLERNYSEEEREAAAEKGRLTFRMLYERERFYQD